MENIFEEKVSLAKAKEYIKEVDISIESEGKDIDDSYIPYTFKYEIYNLKRFKKYSDESILKLCESLEGKDLKDLWKVLEVLNKK